MAAGLAVGPVAEDVALAGVCLRRRVEVEVGSLLREEREGGTDLLTVDDYEEFRRRRREAHVGRLGPQVPANGLGKSPQVCGCEPDLQVVALGVRRAQVLGAWSRERYAAAGVVVGAEERGVRVLVGTRSYTIQQNYRSPGCKGSPVGPGTTEDIADPGAIL